MTHADIIMAKGGPVEFAKAIGASVDEVRVWRARNKLPQTRWLQIHEAFPDLDWGTLKTALSGRPAVEAAEDAA
jgi:hypothetical protein